MLSARTHQVETILSPLHARRAHRLRLRHDARTLRAHRRHNAAVHRDDPRRRSHLRAGRPSRPRCHERPDATNTQRHTAGPTPKPQTVHAAAVTAARTAGENRSEPTGGAAYGTECHTVTPSTVVPLTGPYFVIRFCAHPALTRHARRTTRVLGAMPDSRMHFGTADRLDSSTMDGGERARARAFCCVLCVLWRAAFFARCVLLLRGVCDNDALCGRRAPPPPPRMGAHAACGAVRAAERPPPPPPRRPQASARPQGRTAATVLTLVVMLRSARARRWSYTRAPSRARARLLRAGPCGRRALRLRR